MMFVENSDWNKETDIKEILMHTLKGFVITKNFCEITILS